MYAPAISTPSAFATGMINVLDFIPLFPLQSGIGKWNPSFSQQLIVAKP
jgi:hypothetical protein